MTLHNWFSSLGARAQWNCWEKFYGVGGVGVGGGGKQFLIVLMGIDHHDVMAK